MWDAHHSQRGLSALRTALSRALLDGLDGPDPVLAGAPGGAPPEPGARRWAEHRLLDEAAVATPDHLRDRASAGGGVDDAGLAASSEESEADRTRLIALVELARDGDAEAFGALYDHYHVAVYRFLFYRTRSVPVAEDLASETFFRALRGMTGFRWQGKDFGAWLMTIARNLATDHFKAGRTRLELTTDEMGEHDSATEGPETTVLTSVTNELLLESLQRLPDEQRDCLIMRFLQSMSIAETAASLGRSEGAVKQLQLRGVRNLAKLLPDGMRER